MLRTKKRTHSYSLCEKSLLSPPLLALLHTVQISFHPFTILLYWLYIISFIKKAIPTYLCFQVLSTRKSGLFFPIPFIFTGWGQINIWQVHNRNEFPTTISENICFEKLLFLAQHCLDLDFSVSSAQSAVVSGKKRGSFINRSTLFSPLCFGRKNHFPFLWGKIMIPKASWSDNKAKKQEDNAMILRTKMVC